jgi:hypothetical protein
VSQPPKKSFEDVRVAFQTRHVLKCSRADLEELLAAVGSETITDPADRARATEMGETMRQLLETKRGEELRPKSSPLVLVALLLSLAALLLSGTQAYYSRAAYATASSTVRNGGGLTDSMDFDETEESSTPYITLTDLAKRAPTLRTGTLQAWWAGEQARQVQKLEAQAKRQLLARDFDGAARTVQRADAIRSRIPWEEYERPLRK